MAFVISESSINQLPKPDFGMITPLDSVYVTSEIIAFLRMGLTGDATGSFLAGKSRLFIPMTDVIRNAAEFPFSDAQKDHGCR